MSTDDVEIRCIPQTGNAVRIPVHLIRQIQKIRHLQNEWWALHGSPMPKEELQNVLGIASDELYIFLKHSKAIIPLEVDIYNAVHRQKELLFSVLPLSEYALVCQYFDIQDDRINSQSYYDSQELSWDSVLSKVLPILDFPLYCAYI